VTVVEAYRALEADITTVARRTLGEKQIDAIREIIHCTGRIPSSDHVVRPAAELRGGSSCRTRSGRNLFEELGDL
jgi:hypothetical protein